MNKYQEHLMNAPTLMPKDKENCECAICHRRATNEHHIVPRSAGGHKGPTIPVCGFGNASGCHGLLHAHLLHLWYDDGWKYLRTNEPVKFEQALKMEGWINIG